MAVRRKYTKPIQVVETPEMLDRMKAIADAEDVSLAQVQRDMNRYAIDWREEQSKAKQPA